MEETWEKFCKYVKDFKHDNKITDSDFRALMRKAGLYHNPMNRSRYGEDIKAKLGVNKLFTDVLIEKGLGKRFYFDFNEIEVGSYKEILWRFYNSKNFRIYSHIWNKEAPCDISHTSIYLSFLVQSTHYGINYEREMIRKLNLQKSKIIEDYNYSIDAYDNSGRSYQIKTPATRALLNRKTYNGSILI